MSWEQCVWREVQWQKHSQGPQDHAAVWEGTDFLFTLTWKSAKLQGVQGAMQMLLQASVTVKKQLKFFS